VFSFPNPINEKAARVVAAVVALCAFAILLTGARWLLVPLAYGFWARVLTGPTLSPLGRLASRVIAPRLGRPKYVAGPPKRFAQGMGAATTTAAAVLALGFGAETAADVLTGALVVAATLESAFALCLGCQVFVLLMRAGLVPEETCERCADIWSSPAPAARSAAIRELAVSVDTIGQDITPGDDRLRRGRFAGVVASRGSGRPR
jgi:Domain of unknown function (DUF4395)